jgi:hypothetical protein
LVSGFRLATTCAVPDVIAAVSAHTPAHSLRSHRTRPMLTPRQFEAAQVEPIVSAQPSTPNKQTSRESVWPSPARTGIATECSHRSPVSAGEVEHRQPVRGRSRRRLTQRLPRHPAGVGGGGAGVGRRPSAPTDSGLQTIKRGVLRRPRRRKPAWIVGLSNPSAVALCEHAFALGLRRSPPASTSTSPARPGASLGIPADVAWIEG